MASNYQTIRKEKRHILNTNDDEHMENLSFLLLVIGLE